MPPGYSSIFKRILHLSVIINQGNRAVLPSRLNIKTYTYTVQFAMGKNG